LLNGRQVIVQDVFQEFQLILTGLTLFDIADQTLFDIVHQEQQDFLFALEVPVNRALRDPHFVRQPSNRHVLAAMPDDQFSKGVDNLFAPQKGVLALLACFGHGL
jgi:hypothetical protein